MEETVVGELIIVFCIICTFAFMFTLFIVADEKKCERDFDVYDCERIITWQPVKE
jgi:hypothetical protein